MTQLELEDLLKWKASIVSVLAQDASSAGLPLDDASVITDRLANYDKVREHARPPRLSRTHPPE